MKFICPICKKLSERPDKIPNVVDKDNLWQVTPMCKDCNIKFEQSKCPKKK